MGTLVSFALLLAQAVAQPQRVSDLADGHEWIAEPAGPTSSATPHAVDAIAWSEPFQPYWSLRAEAIVLRRRRVDERSFVFATADNARLLDTTRWSTPSEFSGRFTLTHVATPRLAFELIGFFEDDFADAVSLAAAPGTVRQPFFNHQVLGPPTPQIGGAPALVELEYQSQLRSVELNLRHGVFEADFPVQFTVITGPRYLSMREQFQDYDNLSGARGATPNDTVYRTWAVNEMIGWQLGSATELPLSEKFGIESSLKWTGFANFADARNQLALQSGQVFFEARTPQTRFAGLVEIGLQSHWSPTPRLRFWAGYTAMYFWSQTSAPDILSFNLLNQSKQNNDLAFWIHGPTAGAMIRF